MAQGAGKRAGARRAARKKRTFRPAVALLCLGVTLSVVAWGWLVWAAIDFGSKIRGGDSGAWLFLGLASLGAVACLFTALMLIARLLRTLGITQAPVPVDVDTTDLSADTTTELPAVRRPGHRRAS